MINVKETGMARFKITDSDDIQIVDDNNELIVQISRYLNLLGNQYIVDIGPYYSAHMKNFSRKVVLQQESCS